MENMWLVRQTVFMNVKVIDAMVIYMQIIYGVQNGHAIDEYCEEHTGLDKAIQEVNDKILMLNDFIEWNANKRDASEYIKERNAAIKRLYYYDNKLTALIGGEHKHKFDAKTVDLSGLLN